MEEFGNIEVRVAAFTMEDEDGNQHPIALLGVREDSPIIDAEAARDAWDCQIQPLLDSHIVRLRSHISACGNDHDAFKPVTGFGISTPFLQFQVISITCPDLAAATADKLDAIRDFGYERVRIWATTARNFSELDDVFNAILKESEEQKETEES